LVERLWLVVKTQQLASAVMLGEISGNVMIFDGDVETIRLWLDAGVDVDIATEDGWTALYVACRQGHLALVRLLIDEGARH